LLILLDITLRAGHAMPVVRLWENPAIAAV
jgi:hypothetical protein